MATKEKVRKETKKAPAIKGVKAKRKAKEAKKEGKK